MYNKTPKNSNRWHSLLLLIYMLLVGGCPIAMAQQTDKGSLINVQVVDQYGNPIPEVVVTVKGSDFKTVTGLDGSFSFTYQKGDVLQLSHSGFLYKEVKVNKLRNQDRALKVTLSEPFVQRRDIIAGPYENYDVIIGYRADDSYFSFASAFLNNTISLAQLEKAMFLGKLGEQVVLKSEKAFSRLCFEESVPAERTIYYPKKAARDSEARAAFRAERKAAPVRDAVYMIDILREEWKNDDARLRRNLPE